MHEITDGVWQLRLTPRDGINAYLVGDVLVDAGIALHGRKLVAALRGRPLRAHAITHGHPDHAGGSAAVARAFGVPVWAPAGDAAAIAAGRMPPAAGRGRALQRLVGRFPGVTPARTLAEGDDLGNGFVVLDVPGHSPGHVAFWRHADRTLICGDVLFGLDLRTLRPDLREPPAVLTSDVVSNRASIRRLAELEPALVAFGHGPPRRDPAALRALAAALPG